MEFFADIGTGMSQFIFWGSSFLTEEQAPGLVSIGILFWLLISVLIVGISARRKLTALRWLEGQVRTTKDESEFAAQVNKISQEAKKVRTRTGYVHITAAWDEFRETLIEDKGADRSVLRNSVRPSSFFNLEDLHFGPGFSRYMPGLFVTVGLFLTFLGLISALQQITGLSDASPEEMRASLDGLLGAASAKFIMSLTGLLASIIFTIVLRWLTGKVERRIHTLCADLESRLSFISLEEVAMEHLEIARVAGPPFREAMLGPKIRNGFTLHGGPYHFFATRSFIAARSSICSARSFLSLAFSSSSAFSRLASDTVMPPNLAFQL